MSVRTGIWTAGFGMRATRSAGRRIGRQPFWKQLLKKMSPNEGAMKARKPLSTIVVTAFSREEPQAKLVLATMIFAPL